jgi:UDP-sulfoquinovose synthase
MKTILILGGDGYLGWSLGLAIAKRTDYNVVLADKLIKRSWEKEVGAKLLVPLPLPASRIKQYKKIFQKSNLSFEKVDLLNEKATEKIIEKYRPFAIINAAQQPSAPFSMMNAKNAAATFSNNITSHLNVLFAIAKVDKAIRYIKLGSAGCYMGVNTDFIPLGKTDFSFSHNGKTHEVLDSWLPMHATDFYHQSKIADFLMNDMCAKLWKLKIITVQQSTIFGATIAENEPTANHSLSTRFNYDHVFSTVLNRFVCQSVIGHPITVYGEGNQRTGIISLSDTVENFIKFLEIDIAQGEHVVVHNYTHRMSIQEIAAAIKTIRPQSQIAHLKNPRAECESGLEKIVEVHADIAKCHEGKDKKFMRELTSLIHFTEQYKDNIDASIILPTVDWEK